MESVNLETSKTSGKPIVYMLEYGGDFVESVHITKQGAEARIKKCVAEGDEEKSFYISEVSVCE